MVAHNFKPTANYFSQIYLGSYFSSQTELVQAHLHELVAAIVGEQLKLHIGAVLPLAEAAEAHRLLETRQTTGKVILEPWVGAY